MKLEMTSYIQVVETEDDEAIEIPSEEDGTLLLSNVSAQFPNASGLKYRTESNSLRALRLIDGKLSPPNDGWGDICFICSFPKETPEDKKRKAEGDDEETGVKSARVETKCMDLIVLGLAWKTTDNDLREFFGKIGEVEMAQIKKNSGGQSRGYGFIRFAELSAQDKAISQRHTIEGRYCDVKIPNSKLPPPPVPAKVFVGRLTEEMGADVLTEYFSKYGEVQDVFIPKPFRSFAFVTFKDSTAADAVYGAEHIIKDVKVRVNSAAPRIDYNASRIQNIRAGSGGGRMGMLGNGGGMGFSNNSSGGNMNRSGYGGGGNSWGRQSGGQQYGAMQNNGPPTMGGGGMQNMGGGSNMGSLNPMAVAAALNQAGLGGILNSNYQQMGGTPPVPPPNMNQAPPSYGNNNGGGWNSQQSGGGTSLLRPPPVQSSNNSYQKSTNSSSAWS